jgi:hypothetical protein
MIVMIVKKSITIVLLVKSVKSVKIVETFKNESIKKRKILPLIQIQILDSSI